MRFYVLPTKALVQSSQPVMVDLYHSGVSQFMDPAYNTWNFTHPATVSSFAFTAQTPGCPAETPLPCTPPQCASDFNMSPYGRWDLYINPGFYANGPDSVTSVVLVLEVSFVPIVPAPGPGGLLMFDGPDLVNFNNPCQTTE